LALGIPLAKANTGPFAQFQNCGEDEDSLTSLVIQLIRSIPNADPDREVVMNQVKVFKVAAKKLLQSPEALPTEVASPIDGSTTAKLFEEVKVMFQDLPSRVGDRIADTMEAPRNTRRRRLHPGMLEEMLFGFAGDDDALGLLLMAGLIHDEAPLFYDVVLEVHKAIKTGTQAEIRRLMKALEHSEGFLMGGPFMEHLSKTRDAHMLLHELPRMLHHALRRALARKKRQAPPK